MKTLPVEHVLPSILLRQIGRVITLWAVLELSLNQSVYLLLGTDPKSGRIAVREPRATDRIDMISDLAALKSIPIHSTDLTDLRAATEEALNFRDALAHNVWVRNPRNGDLLLRFTKGSWQPDKGMRGKVSRKVKPEGSKMTAADCRVLAENILGIVDQARMLREEIEERLQASSEKSP